MSNPIRVGIAGLGRSGWSIHAQTLGKLPQQFQIVAAMDFDPERRQEAADTFGAKTYDNFDEFVQDPNAEVIVVATPNFLHKDHVIAALKNGKHAICEKPFGATSGEADEMISVAQGVGKFAAPFQNRRYEDHFQKVREVVKSGVLGELHSVRICVHGFSRRWDWQTLQEFGGGQLTNWGPHVIDHAIQLLDLPDDAPDPEVWADLKNVLSSGDADDHVKIVLRAPHRPIVEIEISAAMAFGLDRWLIAGKNGGLKGSTGALEWKWVDWSKMPERPVERQPTPGRSYNSEKLEWQSDSWSGGGNEGRLNELFYQAFYKAVREGKPLDITPQSVRRQIAVIEKAKELGWK